MFTFHCSFISIKEKYFWSGLVLGNSVWPAGSVRDQLTWLNWKRGALLSRETRLLNSTVFVSMWLSRSGDDPGDQMNELKQKLKSELRVLLVEQHDQIKKKKEQHNTEVQTQILWLYSVANDWQSWWAVHCDLNYTIRTPAEPALHHKDNSSAVRGKSADLVYKKLST